MDIPLSKLLLFILRFGVDWDDVEAVDESIDEKDDEGVLELAEDEEPFDILGFLNAITGLFGVELDTFIPLLT